VPYEVYFTSGYSISDDRDRLEVATIHRWLAEESYWTRGRSLEVTLGCIANSLCLGVYAPDKRQAGFARAVTDRTTMAHLSDVFVLPDHRGQGLGKALVAAVLDHPDLRRVRRWSLATQDAHDLYAAFGFGPYTNPESQMIRVVSDPVLQSS
jgi:GNAT superfamily N-acetyltransferase